MFSLFGCLSDTWFDLCVLIISLKVKAVSPIHHSEKILYFLNEFQKLFDQNPQSHFFRVWTSFMFVDKDIWKLKMFLRNKTVTKCYICEWIFKSCLMKIHKVTSLEYEPDLWKLKLIFPNKTVTKCYVYQWIFRSCLIKNPKSDFFRVWTSFMFVDKDLWKLKHHLLVWVRSETT